MASSTSSEFPINKPRQFMLGGVKVEFPPSLKPYPSQLTCMAKAVTGARLGQNCLLESPTGSGKTMAMLCSLLAWQKHFRAEAESAYFDEARLWRQQEEKMYEEELKSRSFKATPVNLPQSVEAVEVRIPGSDVEVITIGSPERATPKPAKNRMSCLDSWSDTEEKEGGSDIEIIEESDDDMSYFKSPKKKHMKKSEKSTEKAPGPKAAKKSDKKDATAKEPKIPMPQRTRIPKIYFATRTHKQITQVVRELKRTPYRNVRMTILNSREHSCIKPLEDPFTSKTEMCRAIHDKKGEDDPNRTPKKQGCFFKSNLTKITHPDQLEEVLDFQEEPWDIEDLVSVAKRIHICPYFASRELMSIADIIFCPYNYIVDPLIRQSMKINLKDNIVLFDEAHNIEDSFREANSFKFTNTVLAEAVKNCDLGTMISSKQNACSILRESLMIFDNWMNQTSPKMKLDGPRARERTSTFSGGQFANEIEVAGFSKKIFESFQTAAEQVFAEPEEGRGVDPDEMRGALAANLNIQDMFKPSPQLRTMADGLKLIMARIFSENLLNRDDYNVVLSESTTRSYQEGPAQGGWMGKADATAKVQLTLNIWCMNPAIGFADLQETRSVIVTSGTLSPMTSFQSELGANFPHSLSTDHVISPSQVWVGSVSVGPTGKQINGVYRNAVTLDYQDEVGTSILQICSVVPFGVLCFFPSYASMENVMKRWKLSGTWQKLTAMKDVIVEPRQVKHFSDAMLDFDESIKRAESKRYNCTQTGALLLAVCRGKVSEGIDFKDNHARAVITVSIPYPNVMDLNVKLKKSYNDRNQHRQLLPGNQWYEIQAFRAINQALGRCIRHKDDWGAIILLDDRFSPNTKYGQSISKWAAKHLSYYDHWPSMQQDLSEFVERMTKRNDSPALKQV